MAIYIAGHNDQAADMLKYMFNIREAASKHGGLAWRAYDEQFRLRQAVSFSSWAVINNDLWWRCSLGSNPTFNSRSALPPTQAVSIRGQFPCLDFNRGQCRWLNCRFSHICSGCGGAHSVTSCYRAQRMLTGPTSSPVHDSMSRGPSNFRAPGSFFNNRPRAQAPRQAKPQPKQN